MINCKDCQFFVRGEGGEITFSCDPFSNIVEPECLAKWQLIKVNQMAANQQATLGKLSEMVASYRATLDFYRRLAPMQEKMFKVMEREIDEISEADKWKLEEEEDQDHQGPDWPAPH